MPTFDFALLGAGPYRDGLVSGLVLSLQLTGITLLLALPLGIVVALLRLAPLAPLRAQGIPLAGSGSE